MSQYTITEVDFVPEESSEYSWRPAFWRAHISNTNWTARGETKADAIRAATSAIDLWERNDALRPLLEANIGRTGKVPKPAVASPDTEYRSPQVHDVVGIYSRGCVRRGVVEKRGLKNVTVAYVTEVGGHITRKAVPFGEVVFNLGPAAQ